MTTSKQSFCFYQKSNGNLRVFYLTANSNLLTTSWRYIFWLVLTQETDIMLVTQGMTFGAVPGRDISKVWPFSLWYVVTTAWFHQLFENKHPNAHSWSCRSLLIRRAWWAPFGPDERYRISCLSNIKMPAELLKQLIIWKGSLSGRKAAQLSQENHLRWQLHMPSTDRQKWCQNTILAASLDCDPGRGWFLEASASNKSSSSSKPDLKSRHIWHRMRRIF